MDTNLLKIFMTYSQTQNLRMTADLHGTSHVAVIRALKNLEALTGLKISMRVGRGSILTPEGKKLVKLAERVLAEEQSLLRMAKDETLANEDFRIATFEIFSTHLAPEINAAVGLQSRVTWIEKVPGDIEKCIQSGAADIGITYLPIPTPDVEHLKICSIEMGLYEGQKPLYKEKDLAKIPFVVPVQSEYITPTKAKGLDGWPDHRISRNIYYKVTLLETALAMVASSQCIGYFPKFVVKRFNESRGIGSLKEMERFKIDEPAQDVFIVKRKGEEESSPVKKVSRLLRSLK